MKVIKLKQDKFIYCGATYTQQRFTNNERTIYITQDNLSYTKVYTGNGGGTIKRIYLKDNESAHPIYTIEQALNLLASFNGALTPIIINNSQFNN